MSRFTFNQDLSCHSRIEHFDRRRVILKSTRKIKHFLSMFLPTYIYFVKSKKKLFLPALKSEAVVPLGPIDLLFGH